MSYVVKRGKPQTTDPVRAAYLDRLFDESALHLGPQTGGWGGPERQERRLRRGRKYLEVSCDCGEKTRVFRAQAVYDGDCRWECRQCATDENPPSVRRLSRAAYLRQLERRRDQKERDPEAYQLRLKKKREAYQAKRAA